MTFPTALAVGWAIFAAVIVALWLVRYARDWAAMREQEARYAEQWVAAHHRHQHDRHDHADERRPE